MSKNDPLFIDRYSPTWLSIAAWAQSELEAARIKNDNPKADHDKTLLLRARIKVMRELIDLPNTIEGLRNVGVVNENKRQSI